MSVASGCVPTAALQDGRLDPAVLSTLPPSVQLGLMMQLRQRQQDANRQQFEARRAAPADFSQFQMQQYLAATQFRWAACASNGGL